MPTSRLLMENSNGRWNVEFELGGITAKREHFTELNFMDALRRVADIYQGVAQDHRVASERQTKAPATPRNVPVFPKEWTEAQRAAHLRKHPVPPLVDAPEPIDDEEPPEFDEVEGSEDGEGEFEENGNETPPMDLLAPAPTPVAQQSAPSTPQTGIAPPRIPGKPGRKPRVFAAQPLVDKSGL